MSDAQDTIPVTYCCDTCDWRHDFERVATRARDGSIKAVRWLPFEMAEARTVIDEHRAAHV